MNTRLDSSSIHSLADAPKAPGKNITGQNLSSSATSFAAFIKELPAHTKSQSTTTISSKHSPYKPLVNLAPKTEGKITSEASKESQSSSESRNEHEEISPDLDVNDTESVTYEEDQAQILEIYSSENEIEPLATIASTEEQTEFEKAETTEENAIDLEEDDTREQSSEEGISLQAVTIDTKHELPSLQTISTSTEDSNTDFNRLDAQNSDLGIKEAPAQSQDSSLKPNIDIKESKAESTEVIGDSEPQEVNIGIEVEASEVKLQAEMGQKESIPQSVIQAAKDSIITSEASKAAPIQDTKPAIENAQQENLQLAQNIKPMELDAESNTDLMSDGKAEAGTKFDIKIESENKHAESRSIFNSPSTESTISKPLGTTSSADIPPATKQIFTQVQDHIKSIFTNHNASKGESITTINLDPGNLGQISVQIVSSKDGDTQIKLIVSKEATHEMIRESWDVFVKENLEKVSSADNASLSFSLERGDREDARQQQDMWNFHFENSDTERSQGPSNKASYGIAETAAIQASRLDLEAGHANIIL